jgi:inorganic pyrophosphatase
VTNLFHLDPGAKAPEIVVTVVEVPATGANKYEYDVNHGIFKLDRVLHSPMHYPGEYGFIPGTYAEDEDPLDILVLMTHPTFPGMVVRSRPLGYLEMSDEKGRDQKILAVPADDPRYDANRHLDSISRHRLREIEHFFRIYKELEGKHTNVGAWYGLEDTHQLINNARASYRKRFPNEAAEAKPL